MKSWKNSSQMKEQEKSLVGGGRETPKKMELSNLHNKEAKEKVIRMLTTLESEIEEQGESIVKNQANLKNN